MTENILNTMSNRFEFITGDVLLEKENEEEILSTGVIQLDTLLGGGITAGTFLEIVGLSSAGKSQLCMQLAVNVQKHKRRNECVYVDTEGGFSTKRICDIAMRCLPSEYVASCLQRIHHCRCHDAVQLTSTLHRLDTLISQNPKIGLIIVDSVAMPLRGEIDHMRHMIMDFSCLLSSLAVSCRCVVIVVNHVAFRFRNDEDSESGYLASALGTSWSHRPTSRLWMCPAEGVASYRTAYLMKSPFSAIGAVPYIITEGGVESIDDIVS
uniref:DNA repair protein RAD51 homolog 3 n=1 Tax=Ascaris suum TaxID=6253 RepID=F1L9H0_ASCSU